MNQPASSCHGWVDNLVSIGEVVGGAERIAPKSPNSAMPDIERHARHRNTDAPLQRSFDDSIDRLQSEGPEDPHQGTVEEFPGAAAIFATEEKSFLHWFDRDQFSQHRRSNLYYPFASRADWEFGLWLTRSGLSMTAIDKLLSLELVSLTICLRVSQILNFSDKDTPRFLSDGASTAWSHRTSP